MTVQTLGSIQNTVSKVRLKCRVEELEVEIKDAEKELQRLKNYPWWYWRVQLKRWDLRRFIIDMNKQIRVYQNQLNNN